MLTSPQIDGLLQAARAHWREVTPAIVGTLLERALHPGERHALGAHCTPRAEVERLVLPTVVAPLRVDWANAQASAQANAQADAQAAALLLVHAADRLDGEKREDKLAKARAQIRRAHHQLCSTRVLNPACGSGNFLYVTLRHLKRLESEVLNQLDALGETHARLGMEGETVTLQQLRGTELTGRAAALAKLVLRIGWLQGHVRTLGLASVAASVVHDHGDIECRDAVLANDRVEMALDADGLAITRWDGKSFKTHPVTFEQVPGTSAQVAQWAHGNPRRPEWPAVEFIVGNPPVIGHKRMRDALGHGYVQALRTAWADVHDTADFVMSWWQLAADTAEAMQCRRFGLITTDSITLVCNRTVLKRAGVGLAFAIPDQPRVDSAAAAAVRVTMIVGVPDADTAGLLVRVVGEAASTDGTPTLTLSSRSGKRHANLALGADVYAATRLCANAGLSVMGTIARGAGFWIDSATAQALSAGSVPGLDRHIRRYRNGKHLTNPPRACWRWTSSA